MSASTSNPEPLALGEFHPWFMLDKLAPHVFPSQGRLRHLLRKRERNGLARHLTRVGREFFITDTELRSWLDEQREQPAAPRR